MVISVLMKSPNGSRHHICKLDADAHVGRREKNAFDKVRVCRCISTGLSYQSVVLLPHPIVLIAVPMIGYDYAMCLATTIARDVLEKILEPLGNHLIGSKVYILLIVHVAKAVSERRVTDAAKKLQGPVFCYYGEYGSPEVVPTFLRPFSHRVVGVIILGSEIAPFDFAAILLLPFQAYQLIPEAVPSIFRHDQPTKHKISRPHLIGLSRRSTLINEAKVHTQ
jgi:hypothetical protein